MTSSIVYQQKHALIIGINDYPRDSLKYCVNDAKDLRTALKKINFNVLFCINCNLSEFYHIINTFTDKIQRDDLVLFYFAGHGKQNNDENYLLPSDYCYDYIRDERDYIVNHAVNVKYIMEKIDTKECRITIYLLDCCRQLIRTRSQNANQGLLPMAATSPALIVFACAPGKAVQDVTRNNRNGSFIENLLKYITITNKNIEEIMQDVAHDVKLQTNGFQSLYRTSSLTGKVFLVANKNQEAPKRSKIDGKSELNHTDKRSMSNGKLVSRDIDTSKNPSRLSQYSSNSDIFNSDANVQSLNLQSTKSNKKNRNSFLPPIRPSTASVSIKPTRFNRFDPLQPIKSGQGKRDFDDLQGQRSTSVNSYDEISNERSRFDRLFTSPLSQSNENFPLQIDSSQRISRSESCDDQEHFHNSGRSSILENGEDSGTDDDIPQEYNKPFERSRQNSKSDSSLAQSVHDGFQNISDVVLNGGPTTFSRSASAETFHRNSTSLPSSDNTESKIVQIRSLCRSHRVKIMINTTMKNLIDIMWCQIQFDMERYTEDSHVLLLFNHRLHIFVESDANVLVKDFLSLSPPSHLSTSDSADFYVYGLPLERTSSMYNFDNDYISLFGNPNAWCPSYFIDYKQLERPQSILLSSLYALRLYFRPENRELMAERLAMEAQFFLQLRKYFFPPAILAFKHAIVGSMFWFEKSLLMDALIQLLTRLCNPETVDSAEICDFIPLLFCWLLDKCDPSEKKGDCYREVRLINDQKRERSYFQNPVTTSEKKRQALLLEEFDETHYYDVLQHHVDIRSLTLYLTRSTKFSHNFVCSCDNYVLYDPTNQDSSASESLEFWTEVDIKELYKAMARTQEYRSFSIMTRGAVTADVKNQLVLLHKDRTVALLFSQKKATHPDGRKQQDIDHFFHIFDPLKCTKETSYFVVTSNTFLDEEKELPDPRFPLYFSDNLSITKANLDSLSDNGITGPAHQVTVILLDRSRSMSDYRVTSSDKAKNLPHIDICEIMIGRWRDNLCSTSEIHAIGRIEFAEKYKTVCPITRSLEQFDKALGFYEGSRESTCMYDAIREAIRQIKTFTDSPKRAKKDCKKLIICFSDGINNDGSKKIENLRKSIENLRKSIEKNHIVIDFISFIRDDQLKKEEVATASQFRELCTDSCGYIYQHLHLLSDIELAAFFEQEAAVWLAKRSKKSFGPIDKPERDVSLNFKKAAVRQLPSDKTMQTSSRLRRILIEFQAMLRHPSDDFIIFAVPNNIDFWKVILKGPANTPYQEKFWLLHVEFDSHYPNCPPDVRFVTPIFHVNISGDGKICHQILGRCWCQQTKMRVVFESILDLLTNPNSDDAVSLEKAHLYRENKDGYNKQAKAHSKKNAKNDIETLKREYRIEEDD